MDQDQKKRSKNNNANHREPSILPATEITKNPNPRANENLGDKTKNTEQINEPGSGVGSEITDGEDA